MYRIRYTYPTEMEGFNVSDYSRRNRGRFSENDDFDWESFDRKTAKYSTLSNEDSELLRRRRSTEYPSRRRKQLTPADKTMGRGASRTSEVRMSPPSRPAEVHRPPAHSAPSYASPGTPTRRPAKRKRRQKKRLTEKQIVFRRKLRVAILSVILVMIVVISGMFVGMYAAVSREIKEMNLQNLALNQTSQVYYFDEQGRAKELIKLHSDSNSIWVEPTDIASCFKDAIVSIEDERFYDHNGVDVKRTAGAVLGYVKSKFIGEGASYGGSTITQQTIKNITSEKDQTATRKIKEIMRAIAFENQLSKEEILGIYCNVAHFANGCDGVEAAARTYFNKSASELNLQEAASIAGITQYPERYDPIKNPNNNVEKRNIVLKKMYELGKISEQEYETAKNAELKLDLTYAKEQRAMTSYFEDQLVNDVINDLVERKNYTSEFAKSQVYNGGYKIYATVDPKVQSAMESVFETRSNFPAARGDKELQAGMVVTDPYTGEIKGIIGGLGKKTNVRGWNRATQAKVQPGSAIKPIAVYGPAIDLGKITESDVVVDEKITIDGWTPKNAYSGFKGKMTIKEAVARSANIPAVKVLEKVGVSNSYGYLQNKFHISTLAEGDKNYSALALGGLTNGVTVKEMASAYGVFVNSGRYITPHTYTKVLDGNGETVLENSSESTQVISESSAYITASLLSGPIKLSCGTATGAALRKGMPTYGKTGTTDNNYDKWFVGFTPYYVGAVWFGFDTPSSLSGAGISSNPAVTAWKLVFEKISESQSYETLDKPASVEKADICVISGKLAGSTCEKATAYYVPGTKPTQKCTNHFDAEETIDGDEHDVVEEEDEEDGKATQKPTSSASPKPTAAATQKPTPAPQTVVTPPPQPVQPPAQQNPPPQTGEIGTE